SALAEACLGLADADAAGIVMVAESAGLVGATLRRSPALGGSMDAPFGFPEVREWLSFTAERAFPRSLARVAGVVRRDPRSGMRDPGRAIRDAREEMRDAGSEMREVGYVVRDALLRPMGNGAGLEGHFHAAAFTYGPLPRGPLE